MLVFHILHRLHYFNKKQLVSVKNSFYINLLIILFD